MMKASHVGAVGGVVAVCMLVAVSLDDADTAVELNVSGYMVPTTQLSVQRNGATTRLECVDKHTLFLCEPSTVWFSGAGEYMLVGDDFSRPFHVDPGTTHVDVRLVQREIDEYTQVNRTLFRLRP
jgi:hypothetical protein